MHRIRQPMTARWAAQAMAEAKALPQSSVFEVGVGTRRQQEGPQGDLLRWFPMYACMHPAHIPSPWDASNRSSA
jgi:hypothetical protein